MILTGSRLRDETLRGRITIDPFDESQLEPNSYGFRLGREILCYDAGDTLDCRRKPAPRDKVLDAQGGIELLPGRLYLGSTLEIIGSPYYAATLYARRSTSTMGMWIQFSAPLGHCGAIVSWTLEIMVVHPVIVYAGMRIGKCAFWLPQGEVSPYEGKYAGSTGVVASKSHEDFAEHCSAKYLGHRGASEIPAPYGLANNNNRATASVIAGGTER